MIHIDSHLRRYRIGSTYRLQFFMYKKQLITFGSCPADPPAIQPGTVVNIEFDIIGKYIARLQTLSGSDAA